MAAVVLIFANNYLFAQNILEMKNSVDSTYGYLINNPIKIKQGNRNKTTERVKLFFDYLRTFDGQKLLLLWIESHQNPNFNSKKRTLKYRTGMPVNGNLGLLDKFVFITEKTKDTLGLFVDVYNKSTIEIPIGLKIETK